MGALSKGKIIGGKLKYYPQFIEEAKSFVKRNEGKDIIHILKVANETFYEKDLCAYYRDYILPKIASKLSNSHPYFREELELRVDAFLSQKFLSDTVDFKSLWGFEKVDIALRIEEVDKDMQINFISAVAFFAHKHLQLSFEPTSWLNEQGNSKPHIG